MRAAFPSPLAVDNAPSRGRDSSAATAVTNVSELHHDILLPLPDPLLSLNNKQAEEDDYDSWGVHSPLPLKDGKEKV